eukprot:10687271-Ditylum_brightwellii.AAC.1
MGRDLMVHPNNVVKFLCHLFFCCFAALIKMGKLEALPHHMSAFTHLVLGQCGGVACLTLPSVFLEHSIWWSCTDGKKESWRLCYSLASIIDLSLSMPFMKKEMEERSAG